TGAVPGTRRGDGGRHPAGLLPGAFAAGAVPHLPVRQVELVARPGLPGPTERDGGAAGPACRASRRFLKARSDRSVPQSPGAIDSGCVMALPSDGPREGERRMAMTSPDFEVGII